MTEKEKENRIHSFALSFLERQQIVPNLYADQIIRGYKEGYHQAEKDLEVEEVDLEKEATEFVQTKEFVVSKESPVLLIAKHFFELGLKTKGE
jgi:glutaredoxin